jgi:hypothetical protein
VKNRKGKPSAEAAALLEAAKVDYEAHQAGVSDGSFDADHRSNMIAAQRQANRRWGREPQPHGDDSNGADCE